MPDELQTSSFPGTRYVGDVCLRRTCPKPKVSRDTGRPRRKETDLLWCGSLTKDFPWTLRRRDPGSATVHSGHSAALDQISGAFVPRGITRVGVLWRSPIRGEGPDSADPSQQVADVVRELVLQPNADGRHWRSVSGSSRWWNHSPGTK